jgi:iron complex outermembrane receptor protein
LTNNGLPLTWGNGMAGKAYGLQAWADLQMFDWWRLSAGVSTLREELHFTPGSSGLLGTAQAGDDPHIQASLRSTMNVAPDISVTADLHYTGRRPSPYVAPLTELTMAATWNARQDLQIYVVGSNLLHDRHIEFASGDPIERSVTAGARWRF